MKKQLTQVEQFMTVMGQEVKDKVEMPTPAIAELRVRLLEEEVKELREAIAAGDLLEVLDAFTDIRYVLEGAILAFGMQDIAEEAFDRVHDSNMLKVCKDMDTAVRTVQKYSNSVPAVNTFITREGDYYVVKRTEDNKVLKSVDWQQQDLKSLLDSALNK